MQMDETVHGCPVAVVHPIVGVEIMALQVKSGPPRDRRLWLRPVGRAMGAGETQASGRKVASPGGIPFGVNRAGFTGGPIS
jgi:hypothetical protein